jgi:hypothetical protein
MDTMCRSPSCHSSRTLVHIGRASCSPVHVMAVFTRPKHCVMSASSRARFHARPSSLSASRKASHRRLCIWHQTTGRCAGSRSAKSVRREMTVNSSDGGNGTVNTYSGNQKSHEGPTEAGVREIGTTAGIDHFNATELPVHALTTVPFILLSHAISPTVLASETIARSCSWIFPTQSGILEFCSRYSHLITTLGPEGTQLERTGRYGYSCLHTPRTRNDSLPHPARLARRSKPSRTDQE